MFLRVTLFFFMFWTLGDLSAQTFPAEEQCASLYRPMGQEEPSHIPLPASSLFEPPFWRRWSPPKRQYRVFRVDRFGKKDTVVAQVSQSF